ncbi:36514_t:CDS:2, partial [Gigaspora margarita]
FVVKLNEQDKVIELTKKKKKSVNTEVSLESQKIGYTSLIVSNNNMISSYLNKTTNIELMEKQKSIETNKIDRPNKKITEYTELDYYKAWENQEKNRWQKTEQRKKVQKEEKGKKQYRIII